MREEGVRLVALVVLLNVALGILVLATPGIVEGLLGHLDLLDYDVHGCMWERVRTEGIASKRMACWSIHSNLSLSPMDVSESDSRPAAISCCGSAAMPCCECCEVRGGGGGGDSMGALPSAGNVFLLCRVAGPVWRANVKWKKNNV